MDEWKLGYLAGMIDGEGSITIGRMHRTSTSNYAYNPIVYIGNTNFELLEMLHREFGGNLNKGAESTPLKKAFHRLIWPGNKGKDILLQVIDKLFAKREQAALYLSFPLRRHKDTTQYEDDQAALREQIYFRLKELNAKITVTTIKE